MSTTRKFTSYTMCVNIIEICFGSVLCVDNAQGQSHKSWNTLKQRMYNIHALHWMWQGHQQSKCSCYNHMEYIRLQDVSTGCGDVYKTMDHIVHPNDKHHANCFKSVLCVANGQWQNQHFGTHDSCTCACLAMDVATSSTIQHSSPKAYGLC